MCFAICNEITEGIFSSRRFFDSFDNSINKRGLQVSSHEIEKSFIEERGVQNIKLIKESNR